MSLVVESPGAIQASSVFNIRWARTADSGQRGDYVGIFKRLDSNSNPYGYVYVPISKEVFEGTVQVREKL
jgi:hypothetical protein